MLRILPLLLGLVSCVPAAAPEPGPLRAGFARVRMPAPVGIGTAGFGGFGVGGGPTPFADLYPGTRHVHGHPSFEALVLSRGEGHEVIVVRSDTVGVFQQFRRAVVLELEERTGRDLDDALILGATHTHSGPGRVIDGGGAYDLIADTFFPEFYERMVDAVADVVELAYADLAEARLGHATASPAEAHSDRRCEDGLDHVNSRTPLLVVEREGEIAGVLASFAIHGTVLGIDQLTLSADVHGAIEEAVEDRFDHPVQALLLNSWGADMAPAHPESSAPGERPDGFDQLDSVGQVVADAVEIGLADVRWVEDPDLWMRTYRVPIDREHIGYADGVFPYDHGAVFCGSTTEADCDPETLAEGIDQRCIPFDEEYPAPDQTEISVGRMGELHFVTWPGEPGTVLAEEVLAEVARRPGVEEVALFGYSQDYIGYAITEEDWWQGGYEASGALWGPRQGDYLAERLVEVFDRSLEPLDMRLFDPAPITPFDVEEYAKWEADTPIDPGAVIEEVAASYGPEDVVVFTVAGRDPWEGPAVASLERADGTPVTRPGGQPVDSDGYAFWVDLEASPSYHQDVDTRTFRWRFHLPVSRPGGGLAPGDYRLRVTLQDGAETVSAPFTIE